MQAAWLLCSLLGVALCGQAMLIVMGMSRAFSNVDTVQMDIGVVVS